MTQTPETPAASTRLADLPVIARPNGKPYRPRKVIACAVVDDDELAGVIVFGTHDIARAKPLADEYATWQLGRGFVALSPVTGWWRDGFSCGRRSWLEDSVNGRAGVRFGDVAEAIP